ncbi:unnamed protein product [Paramecium octaurelia]|uniref:Uncharacterized protein n=1 Tax=Paramecium octaurelia TaxID=43137 RepID=A0A8S1W7T9_PAROT|nr:unnamed protein product [Paramecium octaurelia]
MNHLSLSQQQDLVQLLTIYISKHEQIQNSNQSLDEMLKQFIKIYSRRFQQNEYQNTLISSQVLISSQKIMQEKPQLQSKIIILDQLKESREQVLLKLDQREQEQSKLEKVLASLNKKESIQHQFEDLNDGIQMCEEKCVLLQEENLEFTKIADSLRQQNEQLKRRYSKARSTYDNNISTLNELQKHGMNLNYRINKSLKIIKDLGLLNQSGTVSQNRNNRLENFSWRIHVQHNQIHFEHLKEFQKNLETYEGNIGQQVAERIQQLITIKQELAQINMKDPSLNSPRQQEVETVDPILTSGAFRFKTHHNLGEKQIRRRQISSQEEDLRAFSELNEEDEVKHSSSDEDDKRPEQRSHKQPWYYKSAFPIISSKNSEKKWENYSGRRKHQKNMYSFASESSDQSFNRMGAMTLKEEFQSIYQQEQVDEDIKEKDTELNDSDEIPQLVQQQSIIQDSTIIINRKSQQLSKSKVQIETTEEPVKVDPYKNLKIAGVLLATCGIAGWLCKKYF